MDTPEHGAGKNAAEAEAPGGAVDQKGPLHVDELDDENDETPLSLCCI